MAAMHCPRFMNPEHVSFKFAPVGKSPFECKFDVSVLFSFVLLSSSVVGELADARFDPFIVDPRSVMLPLFPRAMSLPIALPAAPRKPPAPAPCAPPGPPDACGFCPRDETAARQRTATPLMIALPASC